MSGRYSRYRRTTNYPYRRGVSNSRRPSISQRANANIRNAFQQKDSTEVVINARQTIACKQETVGALNVFDALYHSEFYNNYAPMYDQLRIDKVKAKVTALQWPNAANNNNSNLTIYTAFDRNGLDQGQINTINVNNNIQNNAGLTRHIVTTIGNDVCTYSSALSKNLNAGSPFEIIRYISPSTVQEKSQYISTDSLRKWYRSFNSDIVSYANDEREEWDANIDPKNPCYLEKCDAIPFKPTYLFGVTSFGDLIGSCVFNVELDICVTFRGLRKSRTM